MADTHQLEYGAWARENVRESSFRKVADLVKPDAPVRPIDIIDVTGLHVNVIVKCLLRLGYLRRLRSGTSFEVSWWDYLPDDAAQIVWRPSTRQRTAPERSEAAPVAQEFERGRLLDLEKLDPQMSIQGLVDMVKMLGFDIEMRLV